MKSHVALAIGLSLMISTAVAGSFLFAADRSGDGVAPAQPMQHDLGPKPTPETIAMWRVTAASTEYVAPKVPL
ncbi:MAG TPA: hypothetical protein VHK24_09745 [Steroidobacter sp.]|jgi:hypothetical protein|nr:hypothetical protein [Steroidobacter sp.]